MHCEEIKPVTEFPIHRKHKSGFDHRCKSCVSIYNAKRRNKQSDPEYLLEIAKSRCVRNGRECTITLADVEAVDVNNHCPILTNLNFEQRIHMSNLGQSGGRQKNNSKSLDRIDPSKGYIPGNIRIISWRANNLLKDVTNEEWELLIQNRNYNPSTTQLNATTQAKDNTDKKAI